MGIESGNGRQLVQQPLDGLGGVAPEEAPELQGEQGSKLFNGRSVRTVASNSLLPASPAKASGATNGSKSLAERSVVRGQDSSTLPSLKQSLKLVAKVGAKKVKDQAAHLKEKVLSAPSSIKHSAAAAVKKVKGQNWKPTSEEKLASVNDTELEAKLRERNELLKNRKTLKESVRNPKSIIRKFEKKFGDSLALFQPEAAVPKRGKFKAPGGVTIDFSDAKSATERQSFLDHLRSIFKSSDDFSQYRDARDGMKEYGEDSAKLKSALEELNAEIKQDLPQYARRQKEKVRTKSQRLRRNSQARFTREKETIGQQHNSKLQDGVKRTEQIRNEVSALEERWDDIDTVVIPGLNRALAQASRLRKQTVSALRREIKNPQELETAMHAENRDYQVKKQSIKAEKKALEQERDGIPGRIKALEAQKAEQKSEVRKRSKGKKLEKQLHALDKELERLDRQEAKEVKREKKQIDQRSKDIGQWIKGR